MKKIFLLNIFVLILIQIAVVKCANSVGHFSNPDHPGKCYISADEIYEAGEHNTKNGCGRVSCSEDGFASFDTCATTRLTVFGPCKQGDQVKPDAQYPDCCKRYFHCKDESGKEFVRTL